MKRTVSGFTIVELLIVIVVIAILAAITIVAYNGIQTRAENTKTFNSLAAYSRAINLYAADNNIYPMPVVNYPCLGNVSSCGNVTDTSSGCDGSGRANSGSPLQSSLASYVSNLPGPSVQSMDCGGKSFSGAWYYYGPGGKGANMRAYFRGNVTCQGISGTSTGASYQANDTTSCIYSFPTIP